MMPSDRTRPVRPTPEDLADPNRFRLLTRIEHHDLVPAVQAFLRQPGPVRTAYWVCNAVTVAVIGLLWVRTGTPLLPALPNLCAGMALGYVILLPIHEWVHALAYRGLGARSIRVIYHWRNLTAYCLADRVVLTGHEFLVVCLAPFLILNPILVVILAWSGGFYPVLWGMLLLHVGACSGDFAFANDAWNRRNEGFLTYDDAVANVSYIFADRCRPAECGSDPSPEDTQR